MRILLIEDDQKIAENIKKYLGQREFVVDIAQDKEEGKYFLDEETFDCIILDWMLPDGDGISLARRYRAKNVATPIIFLTARSQTEDKIEGFSSGADDYLTKPFAMAELEARIGALIRRSKASKSSPLIACGRIIVDLNKCAVTFGEKQIDLSPREYSLLEYLILHKNIVVSREIIIRHVWGENDDVLSNTLDVHISNLRKKIFSEKSQAEIRTLINKGYMLCEI